MSTINAVGSVEGAMSLYNEIKIYASPTLHSIYVLEQNNRKYSRMTVSPIETALIVLIPAEAIHALPPPSIQTNKQTNEQIGCFHH